MVPVIALVGRPNVGKSTLFNFLTRTRDAIVADFPGLTRDRQYGQGKVGEKPFVVIDTGGLADDPEGIELPMISQVKTALGEANVVLFIVDAKDGCTAADLEIIAMLRQLNKPFHLVVNKIDGRDPEAVANDFYQLGAGDPLLIAASHGRGVRSMIEMLLRDYDIEDMSPPEEEGIRIAVLGRPNVGKSTLVNRILGEDRVVAFDAPGTTRDSIFIPFEKDGERFTLIDTAGVRRRGRVKEAVEKFSAIKALQAIEASNVVLVVMDAHEGIVDQDAHLLGHVLESGRALIMVVNKWDGLEGGAKERIRTEIDRKFPYLDFAKFHYISALHGSGVGLLLDSVKKVYKAAHVDMQTSELTRILEGAIEEHQPPLVRGRRIKLRYAHQGGHNPPIVIIHGNLVDDVPDTYKRYLVNVFRKAFNLQGTPIRVEFKGGENPFAGRKNTLTERQVKRKKRLMKHVKKRSK